jgi:hypothetical protein
MSLKNSFNIPKAYSEAVNHRKTDHTMNKNEKRQNNTQWSTKYSTETND